MLHERPASCKISAALSPAIPAPTLTMRVCFICSAPGLLQSHRVNCTQTLLVDQALPIRKNLMLQVCHIDSRIILLILFLLAVVLLAVRFWSTSNSNEIMNACAAAGESQGTVAATTSSQTSPPLYLSLNAYRHLNKLSYLGLGDRVEGASTADPGGSSADNWHVVGNVSRYLYWRGPIATWTGYDLSGCQGQWQAGWHRDQLLRAR